MRQWLLLPELQAQAASAAMREQTNLPVKLDEYGRDINLQKCMDKNRRSEARQTGESSTDESDSETTAYQSNRDLLLQTG
ncbi:Transcriptional repressor ILP1 [Vitis vinifera]|uniref:Transcriptional repressor ILP1 n=1 Tax=Vitis vinifera TaxID=29760 RepID=A0A438EDI5_VITVI|nr:Transcriptional repressor ILP1 [Vitis vinifera]